MRIASLVPSSTEMLFALGLGGAGRRRDARVRPSRRGRRPPPPDPKHDPDRPRSGRDRRGGPRAGRIRASLYALDTAALERLDVDLIVTQEVCAVCAVSSDDVVASPRGCPPGREVLSLDPSPARRGARRRADLGDATAGTRRPDAGCMPISRRGSRRSGARPPARSRSGWRRSSGSTRPTAPAIGCRR